ncbi:MAG TPA: PilZ domain-containing protein [Planctomycetota bacterium]|nr:PilZ domain-containing protein [Planctomycetota bacterium]
MLNGAPLWCRCTHVQVRWTVRPEEILIKNQRNQYRATPDAWQGLDVTVLARGGTFHATMQDASGRGMSVVFEADLGPSVELGSAVTARLSAEEFAKPIDVPAIVVRTETVDERLVLGLQFVDWLGLAAALPKGFASLFNLRAHPRLVLNPSAPVEIVIKDMLGAFDLRGVVHDVSRSGLSFSTELLGQCILNRVDHVIASFTLPDLDRRFSFGSRIPYRCLVGESLRYGLWFDGTASREFVTQTAALGAYVEERLGAALKVVSMP